MAGFEYAHKTDGYKSRNETILKAWKTLRKVQPYRDLEIMARYDDWRTHRVNDKSFQEVPRIVGSSSGVTQEAPSVIEKLKRDREQDLKRYEKQVYDLTQELNMAKYQVLTHERKEKELVVQNEKLSRDLKEAQEIHEGRKKKYQKVDKSRGQESPDCLDKIVQEKEEYKRLYERKCREGREANYKAKKTLEKEQARNFELTSQVTQLEELITKYHNEDRTQMEREKESLQQKIVSLESEVQELRGKLTSYEGALCQDTGGAWKAKYEASQCTVQSQNLELVNFKGQVRSIASYVQILSKEATTLLKQPDIEQEHGEVIVRLLHELTNLGIRASSFL